MYYAIAMCAPLAYEHLIGHEIWWLASFFPPNSLPELSDFSVLADEVCSCFEVQREELQIYIYVT